ncbi:PA domain-containing protein [Actinomadura sp. B10D3]|uniref:PA domain-containing protein n=1 Tax=Actinomadura sp. B10D3 TaxID=3153557 RepID=UPI00325F5066
MLAKTTAALGLAVLGLGALGLAAPANARPAPPSALRVGGGAYDVTLPTGDKVHVAGDQVTVTPGRGRSPAFSVSHRNGDLYVVPSDKTSENPQRYNVTALHEHRRPAAPKPKAAAGDLVTVRLKSIARDGRPGGGQAELVNVEDGSLATLSRPLPGTPGLPCTNADWDHAECVQVPKGTYSVMAYIKTMPSWAPSPDPHAKALSYSLVGDPEIEITGDTEIVLDARKAKEVTIETPGHVTKPNPGAMSALGWMRAPEKGPAQTLTLQTGASLLKERVFMQPTRKVRTGTFDAYTRWQLEAPVITMRAEGIPLHPEYYPAFLFSGSTHQFPRLDGSAAMRVQDGDDPRADLRGRLALIQREDGVAVSEQANRAAEAGARMVAVYNDKPGVNDETGLEATGAYGVLLKVPTVYLSREEGLALMSKKNAKVTAKGVLNSPYQYNLLFPEKGRISENLNHVVRTRDLARVDATYHDTGTVTTTHFGRRAWEDFTVGYGYPHSRSGRTQYFSADPKTEWSVLTTTPEAHSVVSNFPQTPTPRLSFNDPGWTSFKPGYRGTHAWAKPPFLGGIPPTTPFTREGNTINIHVGLVDAENDFSDAYTSMFPQGFETDFRVYQDDRLVARTAYLADGYLAATPDDAAYRVEYDFTNKATWARFSTSTKTVWAFRSAHTTETTAIPLLRVDLDADLDLRNRARSRKLKVNVGRLDGSPMPLKRLSLETSFDDGATWTTVPVKDGVARIGGKGLVSLRVAAEDTQGNKITQEVVRAYEVR